MSSTPDKKDCACAPDGEPPTVFTVTKKYETVEGLFIVLSADDCRKQKLQIVSHDDFRAFRIGYKYNICLEYVGS